MDDLISRKQAIEACYNGWNKDYKEIAKDIKDLPPAQPKRCDSSNILRYPECENRTKLGNCNPVGGFFTSVPKDICDAQNHRQNAVDIIHIDPAKIVRDKLWGKAIKREKKEAPPEPPQPKLNKEKISDLLWNEYREMSSHLSAEGVVARRYYCKELWKELFGEEETPVWMTW